MRRSDRPGAHDGIVDRHRLATEEELSARALDVGHPVVHREPAPFA